MTPDPTWPRSNDMAREPALAILSALDATLVLSIRTLLAMHPYADDDARPYWAKPEATPTDCVAPDLLMIARRLRDALESYRNAIVFEHRLDHDRPDDPIPW